MNTSVNPRRAAVCDCGAPWTFLLPFFTILKWGLRGSKKLYRYVFVMEHRWLIYGTYTWPLKKKKGPIHILDRLKC